MRGISQKVLCLGHLTWLLLYNSVLFILYILVWCVVLQATSFLIVFFPTLHMSVSCHIGFGDGPYCSTQNQSSAPWAISDPHGELIYLQGICLGRTTNNIFEYSTIIELLSVSILASRDWLSSFIHNLLLSNSTGNISLDTIKY